MGKHRHVSAPLSIRNYSGIHSPGVTLRRCTTALLAPLALCGLLAGCSKDDSSSSSSGASEASSELNLLPLNTVAFVHGRTDTEAFAAMKKTPLGKKGSFGAIESLEKMVAQAPAESAKSLASMLDFAKKSKLFPTTPDAPEGIRETVGFITLGGSKDEIGFGVYIRCRSGNDCSSTGSVLSAAAGENGVAPKAVSLTTAAGTVSGYSVAMSTITGPEATDNPIKEIYFGSNAGTVTIASSKDLAERAFKDASTIPAAESGFAAIKASPGYQKAMVEHGAQLGGQIMLAFVDVAAATAKAKTWKLDQEGTAGVAQFAAGAPLAIAYSGRMEKSLQVAFSAYFAPDTIKDIAAKLATGGTHPIARRFPENTAIGISLDGSLIQIAKQAALDQAPPEEKAKVTQFARLFESIENIGLAVRGASGASPFPEVAILAAANDAAGIASTVKQLGGAFAQSGGLPVSGWQQKQLSGVTMDYMMSPIGVGAFLAAKDKTVAIGSADAIVGAALQGETTDKELLQMLGNPAMSKDSSRIAIFYLNFPRLAVLLEGVQGSLAMFTGGQPIVDAQQLSEWKAMGGFGGVVGFHDNAFHLRLIYGS